MKRIYTTLALLGALATGAFAQRHANVMGTMLVPTDPTTAVNLGCTDSIPVAYIFTNAGPDQILATDTMAFNDAFTNPYQSAYQVKGTVFNVGDTVFAQQGYAHLSDLEFLWDATSGSVDTTHPFNGDYLFPVIFDGYGWATTSTAVVDTTSSDDQIAFTLTISCTTTGINNVNLAKTALTVYPNPAGNQISFKSEFDNTSAANVTVTDIAGRVVKVINLGKQSAGIKSFNIDISDLNNGMYYLQLVTDTKRGISKFTKN